MIATGFGEKQERKPILSAVTYSAGKDNKGKKVVHLGTIVDDLDSPTWQRKKQDTGDTETVTSDKASVQFSQEDEDKFDIPTFLRKQMD